ncbi:hypothetical protein L6164_002223 [Bauhinia variegata]|uniref:Uncharacterized protein n=1 Tax=Bauhinia variegata TaxID=167791 RepID=A0ACB9PZ11_BAUVA|nr:hypothetical protein L6164_002223 [Bauhinia variegata]
MKKVWLSMRLRYERRVNWIRNNIVLRKRLLFIWGLVVCHSIVEYPVVCNLLMLYLVKFVGQRTVVAAITINLLHSFSSLFVFLAAYIAEVFTNRFNVIVFSTGSYTTGLILLWISAKSRREFNMFYLAIILIAIGKSGRGSILQYFLGFQLSGRKDAVKFIDVPGNHVNVGEPRQRKVCWYSARISGYVITIFVLGNTTWLYTFKISGLVMGVAYFAFYFGSFSYYPENPTKNSLANILKFFKKSISNKYHLLCIALFPYTLVWATANTLFIAQTVDTNLHIGNILLVPGTIFVVILNSIISDVVVFLFCLRRTTQRRIPLMRIGAGMVFAVFSCVAARQVELHRQHSIGPISIFWLVPQYILLGLMEGFAGGGLVTFFYDHLPKSMKSFAEAFSELILCIGKISSIFFLLIINAWFDHHIKDNRFDRYFLILAILCSLFFCLYLACSLGYDNLETTAEIEESYAMEAGVEDGDQEEEESPEDMDISVEEFGDAGYEIRGNIRW